MLILDSGAVSQLAERSREALALIVALREEGLWPPTVPAVVLVECLQGHAGRDANEHRFLKTSIHPGELPLEEYLKPLGVGQVAAAKQLGVSLNRLNELVLGKRGITADTALRLGRFLKDLAAVVDALAGRLESAASDAPGGAEGIVGSLYLFRARYSGSRERIPPSQP